MALVELDGRVGEGGGQVVRVAIGLAALTGTPVRIENVRGNRPGKRGGGLKLQHVASIKWLAEATEAKVSGLFVGSKTVEFVPTLSPAQFKPNRSNLHIKADSAASLLLVFQAILPFLLFAAATLGAPILLHIQGGTNVSWSLSYEYLDQVLLPALERFGIHIKRTLHHRGWSHGVPTIGDVSFKIPPLLVGTPLKPPEWPLEQGDVIRIDITIIVPHFLIESFKQSLSFEVNLVFPDIQFEFSLVEDSKHFARLYTLLVAHTTTGLRFGRDWLYDKKTKGKSADDLSTEMAEKVVDDLDREIRKGGVIDEYLQDQLIVFQALAAGRSSIPSNSETLASDKERLDRTDEPFGDGSTHTTTARWATSQVLPKARWIDQGRICEGTAFAIHNDNIVDEAIASLAKTHIIEQTT
ncbi:RNA 3'-terminal phosphate cyclase [Coleophoma crateriformis]|uniref:RNA 3'-terminal phosphate cyclase n=1 Tax=Coleophoma crateriformis TaxID=565419 RepID=A0A3D8QYI3_9HELO|nr:RNA 3'-terminal phosphate cyclase [Coleophoma crateriformis]